jgi:hypothetical protein
MSHPATQREEKEELGQVVPKTAIPLDILREGSNYRKESVLCQLKRTRR